MSREEIGGTTTPAPEASLAGVSSRETCPASPVGVPADAGAFSEGSKPGLARWNANRLALARHLYANDPRSGEELVAEVNAVDADVLQPVGSWRQLQSHMTYYKVQRHPDANTEALKRRAYTGDAPTIVAIREGVAAGKTFRVIAQALGRSAGTVERLAKQHGIAKAARASKPAAPKPVKVRQVPPPVVLHTERRPTAPAVIDAPAAPPALPEPNPRTGRIYAPFATIRALAAYHGFIYDGSNMDRMNRVRAAMNQPLLVQDDACEGRA